MRGGLAHIVVGEEDVETNDEEEMMERLIAAWKKDVFPKIQQRFRNNSERVQGFAQIEGALRIKMYDIAEVQVDQLYEDSGGQRPPDLHLPTIDDLKASAGEYASGYVTLFGSRCSTACSPLHDVLLSSPLLHDALVSSPPHDVLVSSPLLVRKISAGVLTAADEVLVSSPLVATRKPVFFLASWWVGAQPVFTVYCTLCPTCPRACCCLQPSANGPHSDC
jgi:hypothetical protein